MTPEQAVELLNLMRGVTWLLMASAIIQAVNLFSK